MKESYYPDSLLFIPDWEYTTCFLEELVAVDPKLLTDFDLYQAISFVHKSFHPAPFMGNGEVRMFDGQEWLALGNDKPFSRRSYYLSWLSRIESSDTYEFRLRDQILKTYIVDYSDIPQRGERVYHTLSFREKIVNDLLHGQLIGAV
jgi:hypothetical protein